LNALVSLLAGFGIGLNQTWIIISPVGDGNLKVGLPELIKLAKETGVAVLAITNSHHMAAMWPETEAIAEAGLVVLLAHLTNQW